MNEQPKATRQSALITIKQEAEQITPQIAGMLPKDISADVFMATVMTAIFQNPELLDVSRRSLWNSCKQAALDGLRPDGKEGGLIIWKDKNGSKHCRWQVFVAGIRKKVRKSGEIATWEVHTVHARDEFLYELGDDPRILHRPAMGNRGPILAAYSVATLKSGEKSREVMSIEECRAIRDRYSEGWKAFKAGKMKSTPWESAEGEMVKKTVARRHAKVLPMSSDLERMLEDPDQQLPQLPASAKRPVPMDIATQLESFANAAEADQLAEEQGYDTETGELIAVPEKLAKEAEKVAETVKTQKSERQNPTAAKPQKSEPQKSVTPDDAYMAGIDAFKSGAGQAQWPHAYGNNRELIGEWQRGWREEYEGSGAAAKEQDDADRDA